MWDVIDSVFGGARTMNKYIVSALVVLIAFTGCTRVESGVDELAAPVEIEEAKVSSMSKELYYTGVVSPGEMRNLGFKTPGIIDSIPVHVGDEVTIGQDLAHLDTSDIEFGQRAARATYDAANAQYLKAVNGASNEDLQQASLNVQKAKEGYDLAKTTYDQVTVLYEKGAVSKSDFDQAKTQMEVQKATYEQAKSVYKQAQNGARQEDIMALQAQKDAASVDVERYSKMISDSVITSPFNGYVVEILFDPNEMIDAGYPAVVVRNDEIIVSIGISQKDINLLSLGKEVKVTSNNKEAVGQIAKIADVPDQTTMLYNVEIALDEMPFKVGSIVEVKIPMETNEGIWIPIQYIKIDSSEYVYVASEDRVERKGINILKNINDYALVEGLVEGDAIIIKGDKNVEEGDLITIKNVNDIEAISNEVEVNGDENDR